MGVDTLVGDRAGLEAAFSRGLATLWTACQPILRAHDGSLYAHEALLRCDDPLFPTPGALLAVAERLGRLPELGRAVRAAAGAIAATGLGGQLFVNLHPLDLVDPELMDPGGALSPFASRVVLEVTERAPVDSVSGLVERVVDLRSKGYRIALDDFGAGYAGLNSFTTLSPEIVKLDMGLVRGLDRDTVKQKLVSSMAGLCRDLRILVVAEGIETEGEREAAVRSGCDLLQGFLFGRPLRVKSG
jgi:EAL domain-containing protein (putative c-di-GMP-specific phosphodiesterase class I)